MNNTNNAQIQKGDIFYADLGETVGSEQSGLPKTYRCSRHRLLPIQIRRCGGDAIKVMSGML